MNASERIDQLIEQLTDWRGKTFADLRKAILDADPAIVEEWKYMGSPVWNRDGMIAVANAHKEKVKVTFSHGASLPDPDKHFQCGPRRQGVAGDRFSRRRQGQQARAEKSRTRRD